MQPTMPATPPATARHGQYQRALLLQQRQLTVCCKCAACSCWQCSSSCVAPLKEAAVTHTCSAVVSRKLASSHRVLLLAHERCGQSSGRPIVATCAMMRMLQVPWNRMPAMPGSAKSAKEGHEGCLLAVVACRTGGSCALCMLLQCSLCAGCSWLTLKHHKNWQNCSLSF
jgi:hypothetical protein